MSHTIERRRQVTPLSLVEFRAAGRNIPMSPVGGASAGHRRTDPADAPDPRAWEEKLALMETEAERHALRLMESGERRTQVFAAALGLTALPPDAQGELRAALLRELDSGP